MGQISNNLIQSNQDAEIKINDTIKSASYSQKYVELLFCVDEKFILIHNNDTYEIINYILEVVNIVDEI